MLAEMKLRIAILALLLTLCSVCVAPAAFSQGCAMCSSYVEASSKGGQRAINKAVLLLLIPAAVFMSGGFAMAYRYSRKRDLEQG
jgi:ABC-type sulfate transport system permease subunit